VPKAGEASIRYRCPCTGLVGPKFVVSAHIALKSSWKACQMAGFVARGTK
jgi:hypothetical protein